MPESAMQRSFVGSGTMLALVFELVEVCGWQGSRSLPEWSNPTANGRHRRHGRMAAPRRNGNRPFARPLSPAHCKTRGRCRCAMPPMALRFLRGAAGAALMSLSIMPLVSIYGLGEAAPALMLMALLPLFRGFIHYGYRIENRFLNLWPRNLCRNRRCYRRPRRSFRGVLAMPAPLAFAVSLAVQALASLAVSHALAKDRYVMAFDRTLFGHSGHRWPLTVNAILLYAVSRASG